MFKLCFKIFVVIIIVLIVSIVSGCSAKTTDDSTKKEVDTVSQTDVICVFDNETITYNDVRYAYINNYGTSFTSKDGVEHHYAISVPCHKIEYKKEVIKKDSFDNQY